MRPTAGAASTASRSAAGSSGSCSPSSAGRSPGTPASRAIGADGRGRVAGEDLQVHVLLAEERDGLGRVGAQTLGEHDDPQRLHVGGERRVMAALGERRLGAAEREHAAPGARLLARPRSQRRVAAGEPLGRAEHELLVAEVERAPAAARAERHLRGHAAGAPVGQSARRRSPRASRSARGRWRRSRPGRAPASCSPTPSAGTRSTTRSDGSVSVPVLSVQTTSTEASDSIALSCWASTPRRAILKADTAAVRLTSRIRPSGTRLTMPAVIACTRASLPSRAGEPRS